MPVALLAEREVDAVGQYIAHAVGAPSQLVETFEIYPPDACYQVGVARIDRRKQQIVCQSLYRLRDEAFAAGHECEVFACGAYADLRAVCLDAAAYRLGVSHTDDSAARHEVELTLSDIPFGQTCHAAYAVAAHACLGAVGVEHAHAVAVGG